MIEQKYYTDAFFVDHDKGALSSAKIILPLVNKYISPKSVIDVGCGVGNWLKVWKEDLGVNDIQGIEGPYITKDVMQIPSDFVLLQDLKLSLQIHRRFDLAMSLEVAEHLPETSADHFVSTLTRLSDIVLFSASIPGQHGTYHINEQIPEYWAKKFNAHGFVAVDVIRDLIWNHPDVEWWYKQNIMFYIHQNVIPAHKELQEISLRTDPANLLRIHPTIYFYNYELANKTKTLIGYIRWKLYPLKKWVKSFMKK